MKTVARSQINIAASNIIENPGLFIILAKCDPVKVRQVRNAVQDYHHANGTLDEVGMYLAFAMGYGMIDENV